ncbi:hypothetical protein PPTG_24859 [Phytophthora nicotianae INRA-310]|nr:hypothetical protein PPTG_24859 [Phytophthora nicotianae INRA-310]ETM97694.1 hypothetical protein PPTG_24859 [Phytophthora nicotianae INRA-310]
MDFYGEDSGSEAGSERYGDVRGGEERSVTVQTAVERLERAERQRTLGFRGADEGETTEGQGQSVVGAGRVAGQSEVMRELLAAGVEESKDAVVETAEASPVEGAATVATEVKTEPEVKEEHRGGTDAFAGYGEEPSYYGGVGQRQSRVDEYGYGTAQDYYFGVEEEEEAESAPRRSPSGFIPRYTGPEARRMDRPAFGWSWSATKAVDTPAGYGVPSSGYGPGIGVKSVSSVAKVPKMVGHSAQTGGLRSQGVPTATVASVRPSVPPVMRASGPGVGRPAPSMRPMPTMAPQPRTRSGPVVQGGALNAFSLSNLVSNAVKVLPTFYSDSATVEKARDFWELFEAHTVGLPDQSRLLVFRQKIKGREAERWWSNSTIRSFKTLKVRFHNQFLSRTADELWERLETTKRERGESVEEWGDRVSDLCESLNYPNPQMRYQLFRRGLRNKRMLATLDASPASDIPEACEWLMFKDMYRPVEEDDEFSDDESSRKKGKETPVLASVDALAQQLQTFMQQQQQWQEQMTQNRWQGPRSPRNRAPMVAAATASTSSGNVGTVPSGSRPFRGISMEDDSRTQDGVPVCGRCRYKGHGRATCVRAGMKCLQCGQMGHVRSECDSNSSTGYGGNRFGGRGSRGPSRCFFCEDTGHVVAECPAIRSLRSLVPQAASTNSQQ